MLIHAAVALLLQPVPVVDPPAYWGELAPGPSRIGFLQRWVVDSTRRLPGDTLGLTRRPILLNLWYPTTTDAGTRMPFGDYFDGAVRAAGTHRGLAAYARALVAHGRGVAWRELAGAEPDSTAPDLRQRVLEFFAGQSAASRDADLAGGRLPLVVYTQGSQSSLDDNVVLCEYLASRGYLVVGSAFPREDNTDFGTSANDGSRQRDIRRLVLEVARIVGAWPAPVVVIGHSAGAQVMQLFASDPTAPIDAVVSLDATQDYAMLSDATWAYYTDPLMAHRDRVRVPVMFVAGPEALFELADSLTNSNRWLVTVPHLRHSEFVSQGIIRWQLLAGHPDDDAERRRAASGAWQALTRYVADWLDALRGAGREPPVEPEAGGLHVARVGAGTGAPAVDARDLRTAREVRHLFGTTTPDAFATAVVRARSQRRPAAGNEVLMTLLVDAVRRREVERARATYRALVARDSTAAGVHVLIERRARLFEMIEDEPLSREWRGFLEALRLPP